jgi:hypothetical protein
MTLFIETPKRVVGAQKTEGYQSAGPFVVVSGHFKTGQLWSLQNQPL